MKRIIVFMSAILLIVCTGCFKDEDYKSTEFFLKNNCDQTIEVTSSAWVRYFDDQFVEETLVDYVSSGETLSMRKMNLVEDFSMNTVFSKIEIRMGNQLSPIDALNRDNWVKTLTSDSKDEYTLTVDESFFK